MKYIDVSQKIHLTKEAEQEDVKQALLTRMRRAFKVDTLTEKDTGFHLVGTTGGPKGLVRHANVDIDVSVIKSQEKIRVLVNGYSDTSRSLLISYTSLFLLVLFTGLLPGSIETSGAESGAADALVFVFFGIFIFYDINKKLAEPGDHIRAALDSLDVEFG